MRSSARLLVGTLVGFGLIGVGVAIMVAPPHSTAEASPPPNSEIPSSLICRAGGPMRFELGPEDHYLRYKIHAGPRPKSLREIKPGECASGIADVPLGSETLPALRVVTRPTGFAGNVGFTVSVDVRGALSFDATAQPICASENEPSCVPTSAQQQHAIELSKFARAFQTEGSVFEIAISRDTERPLGPVATFRAGDLRFPKDI